jgi:hypothetical protein
MACHSVPWFRAAECGPNVGHICLGIGQPGLSHYSPQVATLNLRAHCVLDALGSYQVTTGY